ncbi:hypothetical protein [Arsukibacterium sp.]|uniref:hypothetical protein n=1 Tax=Arsukibacterium sp. TaxID=1977258 RepID=UPI001BD300D2|nr:hypothetical protein [Arsukibacterium sp.]
MNQFLLSFKLCLLMLSVLLLAGCGGGGSDSGSTPPTVADTTPNTFNFTAQTDIAPEAVVTSNSISISGINAAAGISIQNGEYSIDNAAFTTTAATVNNAAQIRVRHQAASQFATSRTTTLTVGGVSASFVSTTRNPPSTGTDVPPQAAIVFPWAQSKTSAGTIAVRGTASSTNGISTLSVNGVAAIIQPVAVAASQALVLSGNGQLDDDDSEQYEWTANVEVDPYTNTDLIVSVADLSGNQDDGAAAAQTNTLQAPRYFDFDEGNNRLIGMMDNRDLVAIDLTDLSYDVLAVVDEATQFSLDPTSGRLLYSSFSGNTLSLSSLALSNGEVSTVQTYEPELAEDTQVTSVLTQLDLTNQRVYILLRLIEADTTSATDRLYQLNLVDNSITLLSQSTLQDQPFLPMFEMLLHGERLFATSQDEQLIEINTTDGQRTSLLQLNNIPMALAGGQTASQLYVAGLNGMVKVDLSLMEASMLSAETPASQFPTSQISDALLLNEQTLLVADSSFELVMQIDTLNGERSGLLSSGIGAGRPLLSPQYLTFADNTTTLYVLDDGQNAAESLFAVDLTSGDRVQHSAIDRPLNSYPSGLFYYASNNALLVGFNDAIWSASLEDGSLSVISDASTGNGPNIGTLEGGDLDSATSILYMAQYVLENAILRIDVATGDRSLLEFDGSAGPAAVISGLKDIALDKENNQLFLASQGQSAIYQLDLGTMETVLLTDQCHNQNAQNILDVSVSGIQKIRFDADNQRLLILASQLASYDLVTKSCHIIGQSNEYYNVLPLENGTFLSISQGALKHFDPTSQKQVIISK